MAKKELGEKALEKKLVNEIEQLGGSAWKWPATINNGVPDRIVTLPDNRTYFVELKSPGKKPTAIQRCVHSRLRRTGHLVFVVDSLTALTDFLEAVK